MMHLLPAVSSGTPLLNVIHHMDALSLLRALPAGSVDCVVTSPPYYGLRDYGVSGQIGLEDTPAAFIERLMQVFREVRRVLKATGTVWINLGDSYAGATSNHGAGGSQGHNSVISKKTMSGIPQDNRRAERSRALYAAGLPMKSLMMIPARFAIAMQDEGWILRSEIVWAKKAPMPESVTDRPTKAHEMIYLFAKQGQYFYDQEAVREKANLATQRKYAVSATEAIGNMGGNKRTDFEKNRHTVEFRNLRDVWHLSPEPTRAEHFAVYPTEIPRRCILAGCPEKVCAVCGKPYEREVEKTGGTTGKSWHDHSNDLVAGMHQIGASQGSAKNENGQAYTRIDRGLHPTCACNAGTKPGVVLDMFTGTGTTLIVARKLNRSYIGCDLNPDYVEMSRKRLKESDPFQDKSLSNGSTQLSLFAGMAL